MNGNNRRLRLIWDERGKTLEYTLRVDNSRRGFWISAGNQKGKRSEDKKLKMNKTQHASIFSATLFTKKFKTFPLLENFQLF